jgi:hypothetical protein
LASGSERVVKDRPVVASVLEDELLGEDALPGPRLTHHDVDRVLRKASAEDLVGLRVARADSLVLDHDALCS